MKPLFDTQNYIILPQVLSAEMCGLLTEYARFKSKYSPNSRKGDALTGVHREYGDSLMEIFLDKFTPLVEETTGLSLWPTLSFYYTYQHGHQLAPHKDRSSCEIVAGLCLGADDEFKQQFGSWPLYIDDHQSIPIHLQEGDMVIFQGHSTTHWREVFQGQWFVSAIFGYVNKNGPYAFQRFDQRKQLGDPHIGMLRWTYGCLKAKMKSVRTLL